MRFRPHLPLRLWVAFAVPFALLLSGAVGYLLIEDGRPHDWTVLDALYMSAITLTTVGYLEVHELSPGGRVYTMFLSFGGIFVLFYTATETIRWVVSGEFRAAFGRERMLRALGEMNGHVIVCGLGRMGRLVCQELERHATPFVVIDKDVAVMKDFGESGSPGVPLLGDATSDDTLRQAGVERAKALVTVLPSDADNLFVTLSAHVLNDKLTIVARAEEEAAEAKLRKVGATHVIAPYVIGGHRVAQVLLRPAVGQFVESMMWPGGTHYQVEELTIEAGSALAGVSLKDSRLHEEFGIVVLTLRPSSGTVLYNPWGDTVLEGGSVILVAGPRPQLEKVKERSRRS